MRWTYVASVVATATVFCGIGIASAQWYTERKIIIPRTGWYYTGTKPASGPVQYIKVTYAGGKKHLYHRIRDKNGHDLTWFEKGYNINVTYKHETGVKKGVPIKVAIRSNALVRVESTFQWQP